MSREERERRIREYKEAQENRDKVEVIPADERFQINVHERKERVGAYCRVSTMSIEQAESYEAQKEYYKEYVSKHDNWELYDIYADEGISATSMKRRKNFLRLLDDCRAGKVTLIIAKSVTRFARNAVDCIDTCRELKKMNPPVGVYFENENLFTLTQESELHLNIMAIFAQAESESKSTAVKWGIQSRFKDGIPRICKLYGYIRDGRKLTPDEATAPIVRQMYEWRGEGLKVSAIVRKLHDMGIPSPCGVEWWTHSTVVYILTNERYAGNILMQKTVTVDIFSKKKVKNIGQAKKYRLLGYHPAIVSMDLWQKVQDSLKQMSWEEFINTSEAIDLGKHGTFRAIQF